MKMLILACIAEALLALIWFLLSGFHDGRGLPTYSLVGLAISNTIMGFYLMRFQNVTLYTCIFGTILFMIAMSCVSFIFTDALLFHYKEVAMAFIVGIAIPISIPAILNRSKVDR